MSAAQLPALSFRQRWRNGLLFAAVLGVATVAIFAINALGRSADTARLATTTLARIGHSAQTLNALEWQAIQRGTLSPELLVRVSNSRLEMQAQFELLGEMRAALPQYNEIRGSYEFYSRLLDQESFSYSVSHDLRAP